MKTYTTTEFAKKAHVSVRTVRYYDSIGLLKPSYYDDNGKRGYTNNDFLELQKILSLKFLGFSLKEIEQLTHDIPSKEISSYFDLQIKLVQKKINNLKQVEKGLIDASKIIEAQGTLKWEDVIHLIYLIDMEEQLMEQYQNAENLAIRIKLHTQFSVNKQGWFPWLFCQIEVRQDEKVLEIGCGNGELWKNLDLSKNKVDCQNIILSDASVGMVRDAMDNLKEYSFKYSVFDCNEIPYGEKMFHKLIANHMLFYVKNIAGVLKEAARVLKEEGIFYCTTYGKNHMREISELVKEFDNRIVLSEIELYKIFGIENGFDILKSHFEEVELKMYEDELLVDDAEILADYIFSCHGNQNEILHGRKIEFKEFLWRKMKNHKFKITKEAGVFICKYPRKDSDFSQTS